MGAFISWQEDGAGNRFLRFDVITEETVQNESKISVHPVEVGEDVADHVNQKRPKVTLRAFISNTPLSSIPGTGGADGFLPHETEPTIASIANFPLSIPTRTNIPTVVPTTLPTLPFRLTANPLLLVQSALDQIPTTIGVQTSTATDGPPSAVSASLFTREDPGANRVRETYETIQHLRDNAILVSVTTSSQRYDNMLIANVTQKRDASDGNGGSLDLELVGVRIVSSNNVTAPSPAKPEAAKKVSNGATTGNPVDPAKKKSILQQAGVGAAIASAQKALGL